MLLISKSMIFLWFFIWVISHLSFAQQFYDWTPCSANVFQSGSRYTCNSFKRTCHTFLVYKARPHFQTISEISDLFDTNLDGLLQLNNLTSPSQNLTEDRDVLIPINCFCSGDFYQANFSYLVPESATYSNIACEVFEGLVKSITLVDENPYHENLIPIGAKLHVPLKCSCPDKLSSNNGLKYLVTYPFVKGDGIKKVSKKFGIPREELWATNNLDSSITVVPHTTVLVPLKKNPVLYFDESNSEAPIPSVDWKRSNARVSNLFIFGLVFGILLVLLALSAAGFYVMTLRKRKVEKTRTSTVRSSPTSCLSPDLLSMHKYSLYNYSLEELKRATRDFSEDTKMGKFIYKGRINDFEVMIKQLRYEDACGIIDIYSRINHVNIVQLQGVCYGESDSSSSYLVFEFASNGCLRDCLFDPCNVLQWRQRVRIAFDIATGLHYLHHWTISSYIHLNINSRNVLITEDWRAKIANFETTSLVGSLKATVDRLESVGVWIAPEYLDHGLVSEKVDIFAFGIVLFEIISGKEAIDVRLFKESIKFLGGGGGESGYFEQLKGFIDPYLKQEDYPIAEALCLAVLAKACVEDDPLHRPSMGDILKILARMV